jgi:hypothetical protein
VTAAIAGPYAEMGRAINKGTLWTDYDQQQQKAEGRTKLEDYAKEFAAGYNKL